VPLAFPSSGAASSRTSTPSAVPGTIARATAHAASTPYRESGSAAAVASRPPAVRAAPADRSADASCQRVKVALESRAANTVNNVLTVLSVLLKTAVEWA